MFYTPMHEVTPKVVAMAVSTVITMFRIFSRFLCSFYFERLKVKGERLKVMGCVYFCTTDDTDFHGFF